MRRSFWVILAVTLAIGVQAGRARADFNIAVGSTTITEGGTGSVDVTISAVGNAPLDLAQVQFTFLITANNNMNTLEFVSLQPQDQAPPNLSTPTSAYLNSYLNDSSYVFAGNSLNYANTASVGYVTSTVTGTNDRYDGTDGTNSGTNVQVLPSGALLVRLSLTAALDSQPQAGDTFTISLIPVSSPLDPASFTSFQSVDMNGNYNDQAYTTTPGTVMIAGRAVPEPGSLLLLALGVPATGWLIRRRKLAATSAA